MSHAQFFAAIMQIDCTSRCHTFDDLPLLNNVKKTLASGPTHNLCGVFGQDPYAVCVHYFCAVAWFAYMVAYATGLYRSHETRSRPLCWIFRCRSHEICTKFALHVLVAVLVPWTSAWDFNPHFFSNREQQSITFTCCNRFRCDEGAQTGFNLLRQTSTRAMQCDRTAACQAEHKNRNSYSC